MASVWVAAISTPKWSYHHSIFPQVVSSGLAGVAFQGGTLICGEVGEAGGVAQWVLRANLTGTTVRASTEQLSSTGSTQNLLWVVMVGGSWASGPPSTSSGGPWLAGPGPVGAPS